ncbi:hypothetical protein G7075_07275 [Phycicoccus sp. HDW14]|uniref:hypothetical protein n=1 Tax=Phycicoccus sp. HDW14 TaxID=2714941 RepID=UPI00140DA9A8|nr:hypothetical protein [Phycicoccus sp. HDW14]QIM20978.1 hypothetical protein G7075_07275 [Phycicoccus sp. HDW14]
MTTGRASARLRAAAPHLLGLLLPLLVLGPALGRGVVLSYDLAWSPDPRWTPVALGLSTPAPRAVPSDAVGILLGHVVGAGPAQALLLWGVLVLAATGAVRLSRLLRADLPWWAACAVVVAAVWNPFVLERLVVGQWTALLGYAVVPHLLVLARRVRVGEARGSAGLMAAVACSGVGGANSLVLAVLAVGPVLLLPRPAWRPLAGVVAAALGVAGAWAVPALVASPPSSAVGAAAFAPRPDTPLGTVLSLVAGGGFWNPATHPAERGSVLLAGVALVVVVLSLGTAARALARLDGLRLLAPAALGLALAVLAVLDPAGLWTGIVTSVPGGGVLRDAQKLVAPLVVLAASGVGVLVAGLRRPGGAAARVGGGALATVVALVPVLTLPSLAWGVGGRLTAVEVPADLRAAATLLSAAPEGGVGLLPWSQYRRYAWNGNRVSLSLVPRMVDQRVLADDALPLRSGRVPGEDPAAARVGRALAAGVDPLVALRREGVRYVLVERRVAPPAPDVVPPAGSRVLADTADALVLDLTPGAAPVQRVTPVASVVGWALTALTLLAALGVLARTGIRAARRLPEEHRGSVTRW